MPLSAGDTVELQGYSRAADGYFAANHTSFWAVWLVWVLAMIALYPPTRWFAKLKARRRGWWTLYL